MREEDALRHGTLGALHGVAAAAARAVAAMLHALCCALTCGVYNRSGPLHKPIFCIYDDSSSFPMVVVGCMHPTPRSSAAAERRDQRRR